MLEDRVASDRRRGPRCRHVAILGAAEDGKPWTSRSKAATRRLIFAATTCLTLIPYGAVAAVVASRQHIPFGEERKTSR